MFKSAISEESLLSKITYSIGYQGKSDDIFIPLNTPDMYDCQVTWDINTMYVDGYAIFEDKVGIIAGIPHSSTMLFKIDAVDIFNVKSEKVFNIISVEQHKADVFSTGLRIEFVDPVYFYMINSYVGRGYSNVKTSSIIKEYLTDPKLVGNINRHFPKVINITDTKIVHENLIVPVHKPFLAFMYSREIYDSFLFYHTRFGINVSDVDSIHTNIVRLVDGTKGAVFKLYDNNKPLTMNDPFIIYDLKVLSQDTLNNCVNLPNTVVQSFDYSNKVVSDTVITQYDIAKVVDPDSKLLTFAPTGGIKTIEMFNTDAIKRIFTTNILENVIIEIQVKGSLAYNLLFKVGVDIPGYLVKEHSQNYNFLLSGEYTIIKIVDKYKNGHLIQHLTLARVGVKEEARKDKPK